MPAGRWKKGVGLWLGSLLLFLACYGESVRQESKAQKGEGIYSLLRREGFVPTPAEVEAFKRLNRERLSNGDQLLVGRSYKLPSTPGKDSGGGDSDTARMGSAGHFPIFGDHYARVERKSRKLADAVFYLVSGHGGPDPGAIGRREGHTLTEDEYAYDITLRLGRCLIEEGATVYFIVADKNDGIRDGSWLSDRKDIDEVHHPDQRIPLNQLSRLKQRSGVINMLYRQQRAAYKYHRAVMIHVDSRSRGNRIDVFFYHHEGSQAGLRLARSLRDTFGAKYRLHQPGRGYQGSVSSRNLYMLRETEPPAVYIELGNINNSSDQQRFLRADNRQALAKWICEGIMKDYLNGN